MRRSRGKVPDNRAREGLCMFITSHNKIFVVLYPIRENAPTVRASWLQRPGSKVVFLSFCSYPTSATMPDSDSDFSDELLKLAGAGDAPEKKRKKRQGSSSKSSKRRKPE